MAEDTNERPTSSALTETEARNFIRSEVNAILWRWLKRIGAIAGIANLAALIGIWFTVQNSARQAAETAARSQAESIVNSLADFFKSRSRELDQTYTDLELRAGKVQERLSNTEDDATRLSTTLNGIKKEDVAKATSIVQSLLQEFKENPQGAVSLGALVDTVHNMKGQLDHKVPFGEPIMITSHNWAFRMEASGVLV